MNIKKKLATHVKIIVGYGLVYRKLYAKISPRVEYRLSELCESLTLILAFMWNWGESYKV